VDVQAKDRLTGAVILVVLLVLVVPEFLSGPAPKVAVETTPASDEPPLRSYTVELGDTRHALSPGAVTATPPTVPAPQSASAAPPQQPAATPAAETPPQHLATAPPAASTPTPAAARPQEAVKAIAVRPNPVAPEAAAPPAAGWTVQLGSFASRANAERLVRELKAKGFAAFSTESASGGRKLYRVRVGPAGNHAAGEALAAQLRSAGHPGSLTQRP